MDSTTEAHQPTIRRTTFADEQKNDNTAWPRSSSTEAPLKLADAFIRSHLALLPTNYTQILELASRNHLKLRSKIYKKSNIIQRMKSSDYIPKSARINFEINVSKSLEELPALADIRASIGAILEETQQKLKIEVIKTAELECENKKWLTLLRSS